MMAMDIKNILQANAYCGRGIIIGKSADGKNAVFAYFIMGRSENSRNRVFTKTEDGIKIEPYDLSKVTDPSLIIYYPVREFDKNIIVTNGDQTDTIYDHLKENKSFQDALETRCFEPDAPNFTPRISGIIKLGDDNIDFKYSLSILKSADKNESSCSRYYFNYEPVAGTGHFIHTYKHDGDPIPSFEGEPHKVEIANDIDDFANTIWQNLNEDNKISLHVSFVSIENGKKDSRIINKYK